MKRFFIGLLAASAGLPAAAQQRAGEPFDLSKPILLLPDQAALVIGFRRPDSMSLGKSGTVAFARYDLTARDLLERPRDARNETYRVIARSRDKTARLEHVVLPVSPGDYVLAGATPGAGRAPINSFCLGAPTFRVNAGEVVYFGDVTPYVMVRVSEGGGTSRAGWASAFAGGVLGNALRKKISEGRADAMAYSSNLPDARRALGHQPLLAGALKAADLRNNAAYACSAQLITAYVVPGAPPLAPALPPTAPKAEPPAAPSRSASGRAP